MPSNHPLYSAWKIDDCMEVQRDPTCSFNPEPTTLGKAFRKNALTWHDYPALVSKEGTSYTYGEYYRIAKSMAKSLIHMGVKLHDVVNSIGFNSPEYFFMLQASWMIGAVPAGIYTTNGPDACRYVIEHSEGVICIAEGGRHAEKIAAIRDQVPNLRAIVVYWPEQGVPEVPKNDGLAQVYRWEDFLKLGAGVSDARLESALDACKPGHVSNLIYTSGTTGNPKGVMISHDSYCFNAENGGYYIEGLGQENRIVSFLPMNHVAAQYVDVAIPVFSKTTVFFARPDALRGTLKQTLQTARPTFFVAVPRVWEKFADSLKSLFASYPPWKQSLVQWCQGIGTAACRSRECGERHSLPWGYWLAKRILFNKIRESLGLDKVRVCASSAAPITDETLRFFATLDIPIMNVLGQSEGTAPICFNTVRNHEYRMLTTGKPMHGVQCRTNPATHELTYRGRLVMMGYLKNEKATRDTIDNEGWLHTGDQAEIDADGFVKITGRLKEIIVTAGGENISPVPIENVIMEHCPIIANCVVIGDQRKFLSCLITLCTEMNPLTGEPSNKLQAHVIAALKEAGSSSTTVEAAKHDVVVGKMIDNAVAKYNEVAVSRAAQVRKWVMLDRDLSVGSGELTPTMKLKRGVVHQKYERVIDEVYNSVN